MRNFLARLARLATRLIDIFYPDKISWRQHLRFLAVLALLAAIVLTLVFSALVDLKKVDALRDYRPDLPSRLLDRKGRLITTFFNDHRILVKLPELPAHVSQAFLATEDNHFYSHYGLDFQAIFRALIRNTLAGGVRQGGSTITQQLAKIILTGSERTYLRKAKEAIYALALDARYSKDEILTMYFNQIYFGHGNYGIEAASRFYFQKPAKQLQIGEAAMLAGLPSAPNRYSPIKYPHNAILRLAHVLRKMVDQNHISQAQAVEEFQKMEEYFSTLNISPETSAFGTRVDNAPYFSETVRQLLTTEIGEDLLYKGGLTIYSSLDLDHQNLAQNTLWDGLKRQNEVSRRNIFTRQLDFSRDYNPTIELASLLFDLPATEKRRNRDRYQQQLYFYQYLSENTELINLAMGGDSGLHGFLQQSREINPFLTEYSQVEGAFIEIDQKTGDITAMVGGSPFNAQNQINRALQMVRQPGSTFKPILYAAALENKVITAATIFPDSPMVFLEIDGSNWIPENYSGGYRGFITVREALTYSANMVSIAIAREAGMNNLLPLVSRQLGVKEGQIPSNLSVALGSYEISPLQLAQAFATFARGGRALQPVFLHRIVNPDGSILRDYSRPQSSEQILKPETAAIITSLLQNVVDKGTGKVIRNMQYNGFAAGKTGTSNSFRDAWFVGFNERYTSAVWMGYDRPTLNLGSGQAGGAVAAPIWGQYQFRVQNYRKNEESELPAATLTTVKICPLSGKLATADCPDSYDEFFIPETEPKENCTENHKAGLTNGPASGENQQTLPQENFFENDQY